MSILNYSAAMKKLAAIFYRQENGAQPVRDWLLSLTDDDRRIIGRDIATVEFGWPVGMPVCRSLGHGLWEVRSTIRNGRLEVRLYFVVHQGQAVLLHGHTGKDTQKRGITQARERLTDLLARMERRS